MTFTYTDTLLTDRDLCRFLCGDVTSGSALFTDEEIAAVVAKHANAETAAGYLLRILANDPERTESLWDSTYGAFSRAGLSQRYGRFADRWLK